MCGRFTLTENIPALMEQFDFEFAGQWEPRYNIAPSQEVLAIGANQLKRRGAFLKWGLVPFWAKDAKMGYKMINARGEEIDEKPAFREAFRQRRCLIMSDGFYEWRQVGKSKQPYRFVMKDRRPFAFAGLYEMWRSPDNGELLQTCTVITTAPNDVTREVHDRMPVILQANHYDEWLSKENQDVRSLKSLLVPYPADEMMINSPRNDGAELVKPVSGM